MALALPHVRRQPKFAYAPSSRGGDIGASPALADGKKGKHSHHRSQTAARRFILPALAMVVTALLLLGSRNGGGQSSAANITSSTGSNAQKARGDGNANNKKKGKKRMRDRNGKGRTANNGDPTHPPVGMQPIDVGGLCTKTNRCTLLYPAGDVSDHVTDEAVKKTGMVKVEAALQFSYDEYSTALDDGSNDANDKHTADQISAVLTRRGAGIGHEINQDRSFVLHLPRNDFAVGIFDGLVLVPSLAYFASFAARCMLSSSSSLSDDIFSFRSHGENGHSTSHYVSQQLPRILANELSTKAEDDVTAIHKILTDSFLEVDSNVDELAGAPRDAMVVSGSTAIVALKRGHILHIGNTGDSLAFVVRRDRSTGATEIVYRTKQHKPDLPEERERIEGKGGEVLMPPAWAVGDSPRVLSPLTKEEEELGVLPIGLAMSRSIGDRELKNVGVIADPTIDAIDIESLSTKGADLFVVASTDGLYDHVPPETLAERLGGSISSQKLLLSAMEELIMEASNVWLRLMQGEVYRDDISLSVVKI